MRNMLNLSPDKMQIIRLPGEQVQNFNTTLIEVRNMSCISLKPLPMRLY